MRHLNTEVYSYIPLSIQYRSVNDLNVSLSILMDIWYLDMAGNAWGWRPVRTGILDMALTQRRIKTCFAGATD